MAQNGGAAVQGLDSSGQRPEHSLAGQLGELARTLQGKPDLQQTLHAIVAGAMGSIAVADYAGITLVSGDGKVSSPAVSGPLVERIDQLQYETGQGPCLSSVRGQATVRADDLRTESRWPKFADGAADLGIESMLCFQLYVKEQDLGALNLYASAAGAFTEEDEETGLLFATHAAIALVGAQHEHTLHQAMTNCDVIGQSKGILMERHKLDAATAFLLLVRASQNNNRKMHEIARMVATTGEEPQEAAHRN